MGNFYCEVCFTIYPTEWELKRHAISHGPPTLPCPECELLFKRPTDLRRHINSVHRNNARPFICAGGGPRCAGDPCGTTFARQDALRRHQKPRKPKKTKEPKKVKEAKKVKQVKVSEKECIDIVDE